jgi:hypothetical protein
VGSNFKCKYSGKGKPVSVVFNDKWGLTLKQNGWGKGGKKWSKNWLECEQTYKELMCMTGQKLQFQLLQGRTGGSENQYMWRTTESKMRTPKIIRVTVLIDKFNIK